MFINYRLYQLLFKVQKCEKISRYQLEKKSRLCIPNCKKYRNTENLCAGEVRGLHLHRWQQEKNIVLGWGKGNMMEETIMNLWSMLYHPQIWILLCSVGYFTSSETSVKINLSHCVWVMTVALGPVFSSHRPCLTVCSTSASQRHMCLSEWKYV